tara:strand:- start:844 stop:1338 length:495 start_codon:yes stop_codon:yes gene_type:complete
MKNNILILHLIFATITLFSCKSSKDLKPKESPITFTEIKTGENSNYLAFTTFEIRNFNELTAVWVNLFANYDRKPPIPSFDFENKMLIAVALGERNNGSYSIKIESVLETKNRVIIIAEENKPGSTCNSPTVMVYPFQLIEIPKTDKEITFTKTLKVNECGKGF